VQSTCERDNDPSGSIKCWEIIEWRHNGDLSSRDHFHSWFVSSKEPFNDVLARADKLQLLGQEDTRPIT
jgi:hypothetical protein